MKLQVFSVYDIKARAFAFPFYCGNTEIALRYLAEGANDPTLQLCKNSEDFTLYHLGEWNDENAEFKSTQPPMVVARASDLKRTQS